MGREPSLLLLRAQHAARYLRGYSYEHTHCKQTQASACVFWGEIGNLIRPLLIDQRSFISYDNAILTIAVDKNKHLFTRLYDNINYIDRPIIYNFHRGIRLFYTRTFRVSERKPIIRACSGDTMRYKFTLAHKFFTHCSSVFTFRVDIIPTFLP